MWYHLHIGAERCPVVDTWWQTETGSILITGLPGVSTMKPGFAGTPLPGISATILDENGREVKEGSGLLAITHPWPVHAPHRLGRRRALREDLFLPLGPEDLLPGRWRQAGQGRATS